MCSASQKSLPQKLTNWKKDQLTSGCRSDVRKINKFSKITKSLNSETILALRPVKTCGILASIAGGHRDLTSSQVTLGVDPKNLFVFVMLDILENGAHAKILEFRFGNSIVL